MGSQVKVWTKQHQNILDVVAAKGRYIVKKEYIEQKMEDHSGIYLGTYAWLYQAVSKFMDVPADVRYPVWVSVTRESSIHNSEGNVVLELTMEEDKLLVMDLEKWGYIVNYMYIPKDKEDELAHEELLKKYRIDDSTAYMSSFYPNIKSKIIKSWDRLFDDDIVFSPAKVGIIWEVKKEWITGIER